MDVGALAGYMPGELIADLRDRLRGTTAERTVV